MVNTRSIEARTVNAEWFARRTRVTQAGCWEWTKAGSANGYGVVSRVETNGKRRQTTAHRYVWEQVNNDGVPLPPDQVVCHHCDNPPCVNPAHLFVGSQRDNLADMTRKGRRPAGEKSHLARLTQTQVDEIRRRHVPRGEGTLGNSAALAVEFGIARDHVTQLIRGRNWGGNAEATPTPRHDWGEKTCIATGCDRRRKAKGMCNRCYKRWQKSAAA